MWRGVGAISFYVPAYLVLVVMSVCVISIPTHLAANRERGLLRRYRASAISPAAIAAVRMIDQPWLRFDQGSAWLVFVSVAAVGLILGLRCFRWE